MEAGTTIAQYLVRERLGKGGMGEVWLAEDTALGRKVALKFLSARLRHDPSARRRFLRESRAAAALDHPFICKVYEAGEAGGEPYIAMEYLEGVTLRDRLAEGRMPLPEVLQTAGEVAEALEEAHRRGVIHRDLKPSNIFLTHQGHVKVMDFGLAKRLATAEVRAQESTTQAGIPAGTPAYLSPDQLRGEQAGPRSDIFSFGIILYQMIAGVHPFMKGPATDTMHAILHQPERPLSAFRDDLPELLQHTVRKMLAKDPRLRYQSIHEVRTDLLHFLPQATPISTSRPAAPPLVRRRGRAIGAIALAVVLTSVVVWLVQRSRHGGGPPPATAADASIAVLPFADMSPEGNLEYFCDGITEQIISDLAAIEGLRVTARTSAFSFKGMAHDVREIGRRLGVGKLLEGSVRQTGDNLRITVQLVDAADGFHVWARTYDRELTDALAVQEEIAREIAQALEIGSGPAATPVAVRHPTENPEAYLLYLQGRFHWNKRTAGSLETAIGLFERALELDPGFALAYTGIADAYNLLEVYGGISPREATTRARAAVDRALQLDDTLAEAHASLGILKEKEWDYAGAGAEYRRALELRPGDATTRCWYAQLLAQLGRIEDALREIGRAVEVDPLSPYVNTVRGSLLYVARRYDEAVRQLTFTLELDPGHSPAHAALAYTYSAQGKHEQALASALRSAELSADADRSSVLGYVHAMAGRHDEALAIVERMIALWRQRQASPARIAIVYTALGDRDRAFEWLERARSERDIWITQLAVDPIFDGLRSDPRFPALLGEVGLGSGAGRVFGR